MKHCLVVSPHLDDAALSASTQLGAGGVTVVTLFSAIPSADWPTTWWDRLTGAASSRDRQAARQAEDAAAMRLLGAKSIYLDELELLYRDSVPDLSAATVSLAECFRDAADIWLPAAIGGHPDHVMTRDAGLRAAAVSGRTEVTLYADYPYVLRHGWPPSLTGQAPTPFIDADYWLAYQLAQAGLDTAVLEPELVVLDPAQRALKSEVIRAYESQTAALSLAPADLAADPAKLDYELRWKIRQ
ncbi:MAG TPA: PIG-L family deacetylase [Streptosporangiaceae bacterium]|jgi:LmbE family N-acetylglucosaminyl deacetylase